MLQKFPPTPGITFAHVGSFLQELFQACQDPRFSSEHAFDLRPPSLAPFWPIQLARAWYVPLGVS